MLISHQVSLESLQPCKPVAASLKQITLSNVYYVLFTLYRVANIQLHTLKCLAAKYMG